MNKPQAKELLTLFRPGTDDPHDPEFAEALSLAKADPELERWFELHCQAHQEIRAKFKQIPVPEGLKEQILAERKVHTTPLTRFARRPASTLAVAVATLLLIIGLASLWLRPREENHFADFRNRMVGTVVRSYPQMELKTDDLAQIQRYLANRNAPGNYILPQGLTKAKGTGCAILTWQGRPVSMICFNSGKTPGSTDPDLFLFVVDRTATQDAPQAAAPQVATVKHLATASWSVGDKAYVLATARNGIEEYF